MVQPGPARGRDWPLETHLWRWGRTHLMLIWVKAGRPRRFKRHSDSSRSARVSPELNRTIVFASMPLWERTVSQGDCRLPAPHITSYSLPFCLSATMFEVGPVHMFVVPFKWIYNIIAYETNGCEFPACCFSWRLCGYEIGTLDEFNRLAVALSKECSYCYWHLESNQTRIYWLLIHSNLECQSYIDNSVA